MNKMGEGAFGQNLMNFTELHLSVAVTVLKPGTVVNSVWEDPSQPVTPQTYFHSHVALTPFHVTMKFQEGPDEEVIIEQGRCWPYQEIRAGFRQVLARPLNPEEGGEGLCVGATERHKYSLSYQLRELEKGQSLAVMPGNLLLVCGSDYLINGQKKSSPESPWSITACAKEQAVVKAVEPCRILLYQAVPLEAARTKAATSLAAQVSDLGGSKENVLS